MRSNPLRSFLVAPLALLLALALNGCSLKLNDKVTKPQASVNTGTGCLSETSDVLDRFQKGTLSSEDHSAFFACATHALTTFLNDTNGKNKDYYEPSELSSFLTKYFLQGKEIQPALLTEWMALKTAFVGGSADRISRDDLRRMIDVTGYVRDLTAAMRPLMPLDAKSFLSRGYSGEEFEAGMRAIINAAGVFGSNLKGGQSAYPFEHLSNLIREMRTFLYPGGVPSGHWTDYMLRLANALPPAKVILIASPRDQITPDDWQKIYRLAPRYFASVLRVQFYLSTPFSSLNGGGLKTVESIFNEFVHTFDFILNQHPGHLISSEEIDDLVLTFYDQQMLPCRPDTARQFVKALFGKLLGTPGDPNKFSITSESLSHFKENVSFLLEGLHATEALYRVKFGNGFADGILTREDIAAVPDAILMGATSLRNNLSIEAVAAVKRTPQEVHTVFARDSWNVIIPEHGTVNEFSYFHMLKMHALRSLNRLLIEAYASPGAGGLTQGQVEGFVGDIFPMMIDLHLADDSMRASISKRVSEASLFLYASDGNAGLTMNEALEMEAILFSTITRAPRNHALLAEACASEKKDKEGKPLIASACYRTQIVAHADEVWSYLPGLARYVKALPPDQQLALFDRMASFLRSGEQAGDDFTQADSQSFTLLPYYVELLFTRFD